MYIKKFFQTLGSLKKRHVLHLSHFFVEGFPYVIRVFFIV